MYKVIVEFTDLQDKNYLYKVGENYPRSGFEVLPGRIKELASTKNRRGIKLIEEIKTDETVLIEEIKTDETVLNDESKKTRKNK